MVVLIPSVHLIHREINLILLYRNHMWFMWYPVCFVSNSVFTLVYLITVLSASLLSCLFLLLISILQINFVRDSRQTTLFRLGQEGIKILLSLSLALSLVNFDKHGRLNFEPQFIHISVKPLIISLSLVSYLHESVLRERVLVGLFAICYVDCYGISLSSLVFLYCQILFVELVIMLMLSVS